MGLDQESAVRVLPLEKNDPTASLYYPFPLVYRLSSLFIITVLIIFAPTLIWPSIGGLIKGIFPGSVLGQWVVPSLYTIFSVFLAFLLAQTYQGYQEYKRERLRLAGILRNWAMEAIATILLFTIRRKEYQNVPNDPQQRLDFIKGYVKTLDVVVRPLELEKMVELLDCGTFHVAMDRWVRMVTTQVGATHELSSAELNLKNEQGGAPDAELRDEVDEAWCRLEPLLTGAISIHEIWLNQINDRLSRLRQEKVVLNLPAYLQQDKPKDLVATSRRDVMEKELEARLDKSLEIAIDNRKFEIDLLWRRALVFWGFVAVLFVAVAAVKPYAQYLALGLSAMGVVFSLVWALVNRASKSWQESWEIKARKFFEERYGSKEMYKRVTEDQGEIFFMLRPRNYSVSRLLIALSDYLVIFWAGLVVYLGLHDRLLASFAKQSLVMAFIVFSIFYGLYILWACRSRDE